MIIEVDWLRKLRYLGHQLIGAMMTRVYYQLGTDTHRGHRSHVRHSLLFYFSACDIEGLIGSFLMCGRDGATRHHLLGP